MTHQELLTEINSLNDSCSVVDKLATTLRSVVNLHSPEGNPTSQCANCRTFYPCHTIKAIERELQ